VRGRSGDEGRDHRAVVVKQSSVPALHPVPSVEACLDCVLVLIGTSQRTVRRYLRAPVFPERKPRTRSPGQLAPYRAYLQQRWNDGCHNASQLWRELREQGPPDRLAPQPGVVVRRVAACLWPRAPRDRIEGLVITNFR
jgi:hypothetical protein